jgi:dihydroneopterin aldolase
MRIHDTFVKVEGLRVYAHHGVLPIERKVGNMFEVSVSLYYDALPAMMNDNIETALNYANVVAEIVRVMASPEQLLEHVAYNIVNHLNSHFHVITHGELCIKKLKPPISEHMSAVNFSCKWEK